MPSLLPDFSAFLERFVDDELRRRVDRIGLAVNEFGYDRWGGSPASAMRMLVVVRWLYRNYFRVETSGLEHLPPGRMMVVGNHSAQLAYDGMLVAAAVALEAEPPRMLRAMVEYFFANVPLVSTLMNRLGQLTGTPENAERLLAEEDAASRCSAFSGVPVSWPKRVMRMLTSGTLAKKCSIMARSIRGGSASSAAAAATSMPS